MTPTPISESVVRETIMGLSRALGHLEEEKVHDWMNTAKPTMKGLGPQEHEQMGKWIHDQVDGPDIPTISEITKADIARWFEMSTERFEQISRINPQRLQPEVLIRHHYLEHLFQGWLEEWGYEVEIGKSLDGEDDISFLADVYGIRHSLHGDFEIAICFICDDPPSDDRAQKLFEVLEAVTQRKRKFGRRDILMLVTHDKFSSEVEKMSTLQNKEEPYVVILLGEAELDRLARERDGITRMQYMRDLVMPAYEESEKGVEQRLTIETPTSEDY